MVTKYVIGFGFNSYPESKALIVLFGDLLALQAAWEEIVFG